MIIKYKILCVLILIKLLTKTNFCMITNTKTQTYDTRLLVFKTNSFI